MLSFCRSLCVSFLFLALGSHVAAIQTGIRRAPGTRATGQIARGEVEGLNNFFDIRYYVNITVDGQPFMVLLDTGSSDLWVAGNLSLSNDTGKDAQINYAVGSASGRIKISTSVELAGLTIPSVPFLEVQPSDSFPEGFGLLGLGPYFSSVIWNSLATLDNPRQGLPLLNDIFVANSTVPNFFSVLLGRDDDPDMPIPGDLSIGLVLPGYEAILEQPKLNLTTTPIPNTNVSVPNYWQVLLDEDGILGPDGQPIPVVTKVSTTQNKKQLTSFFDSGFSVSQVPESVATAIYSKVNGSRFDEAHNVWVVPCTAEVNVTFRFAGQFYPVHPLDTTLDTNAIPGTNGGLSDANPGECTGLYQPIVFDNPEIDMILGMSFLRSVYMLVDLTNAADASDLLLPDLLGSYVQLLSTLNGTAHAEFVKARLNGTGTAGNQYLLPASNYPSSSAPSDSATASTTSTATAFETVTHFPGTATVWLGSSPSSVPAATAYTSDTDLAHADLAELAATAKPKAKSFLSRAKKILLIIVGCVCAALILLAIAFRCFCRCRKSRGSRGLPVVGAAPTSYRQLDEPAPAGEMEQVHGYRPSGEGYSSPWDKH